MDNAVDALHIAFVAMVLVIALSVAIYMITLARQTSEIVFKTTDDAAYLTYEVAEKTNKGIANQNRIVGFETIIPTLFKYNLERYAVVFLDASIPGYYDPETGIIHKTEPLIMYHTENTTNWPDHATFVNYSISYDDAKQEQVVSKNLQDHLFGSGSNMTGVCTFDLTEEGYRAEPWIQGEEIKKHLKALLFGEIYEHPGGSAYNIDYSNDNNNKLHSLYKEKGAKFIELVGHYKTIEEADTVRGNKTTSKTVIIYVYIGNS
jgi:hypothetical protein